MHVNALDVVRYRYFLFEYPLPPLDGADMPSSPDTNEYAIARAGQGLNSASVLNSRAGGIVRMNVFSLS